MNHKYKEYLNSKEWLELRLDILTNRVKCERCGSKNKLQVHHKHYKNIFKEEPGDLELLCGKCHSYEHKKENKPKKNELTLEQKVRLMKKKLSVKKRNKFRLKKKYGII